MHRTFAEVNLSQYKKNLQKIKNLVDPKTKIMAVVKADGYGHGVIPISQTALACGANYLGVACISEALEIRAHGITAPVLLLSEPVFDVSSEIIESNITTTVYSPKWATLLAKKAQQLKKQAKVHCKIDTGMGRIGIEPKAALSFIKEIKNLEHMELEGIFTHFAKADDKKSDFTNQQYEVFSQLLNDIKSKNINIPIIHAANSDAISNYPHTHFNMVRLGLASYENLLNFKSHVGFIKQVPAQTSISYGCEYVTPQKTNIGTVMAGYGDGVPKSLSNRGRVLINGQSFPIVGRICMDMFMVDLGKIQINIGDEVVILGHQKENHITIDEICRITKQIPYEVMCGISKRVPRIYIK